MSEDEDSEEGQPSLINMSGVDNFTISGDLTLTGFGEGTAVELDDVEDGEIQGIKIEGSGEGTGIHVSDSEDIDVQEADIDNTEKGIVSDDSDLTIQRVIFTQNSIGVEALAGSDVVFINCEFTESEIADLLYYDEVKVAIYDTLAQQIMDLSGDEAQIHTASEFADSGHFIDRDDELYRIAKAVRDTSNQTEKEEQTRRLLEELQSGWDTISDGLETVSKINAAIQLLKYILLAAAALGLLK